jgi:hypothetical protein
MSELTVCIGDMPIIEVPERIRALEAQVESLKASVVAMEKWRDEFCRIEQARGPLARF